jgi:alpha-galactosidase/6-phospho-beta-glucosidase family protein
MANKRKNVASYLNYNNHGIIMALPQPTFEYNCLIDQIRLINASSGLLT